MPKHPCFAVLSLAVLPILAAQAQTVSAPPAPDWPTWGYDAQRSGWNRGETALDRTSVGRLALKWDVKVATAPMDVSVSTLTAPVVASQVVTPQGRRNVLIVQGSDGQVFALDADSGRQLWARAFPTTLKPQRPADVNCPNVVQATPVIDKPRGLVFFTTLDGRLHGAALASGAERLQPISMVAPFSRSWSLNLVDNVVYVASGRGCGNGNPVEAGSVSAVDVSDLQHPQLSRFTTSKGRPAGPWGRGGPVLGPEGLYVQTADGPTDFGAGIYGHAVVAVAPRAFGLADLFVPSNWKYLNTRDLDFGSGSPVIFSMGRRTLLATGAKESVLYLLDAANLGGGEPAHDKPLAQTPRLGNDEQTYAGKGIWGGLSTWQAGNGDRFLYVPLWGAVGKEAPRFPVSNGDAPDGSVMAFRVRASDNGFLLEPAWISRNLKVPDSVAVANGLVFAVQTGEQTVQHMLNPEGHGRATATTPAERAEQLNAFRSTGIAPLILYALDAETGRELWSSGNTMKSFSHFSQPVVALGKVFVVTHDAHVYAFGLN